MGQGNENQEDKNKDYDGDVRRMNGGNKRSILKQ